MKYTAQKFKEDIENYLEGEKTHVTSDQANESEYVPKHALPRRPQPKVRVTSTSDRRHVVEL